MYSGETVITELLKKQPSVVLGSYGETLTLVSSKYLAEAKVPGITISSSNPLITANNEYFFRATYAEESQGTALADFAVNELERTKAVIIKVLDDDTLSAEITAFTEEYDLITPDMDGVLTSLSINSQDTDYTYYYDRVKNSGANCCFVALQPEAAKTFIEGAVDYGLRYVLFLGTRLWDCDSMKDFAEYNPSISIAFCSTDTKATGELATEFTEAYKAKYGENSEPTGLAASGFDAYLMAIEAIKKAYDSVYWQEIPSGNIIRDKLLEIKGFDGASGIISFDGSNEATTTVSIHSYHGSALEQYVEEAEELLNAITEKEEQEKLEGEKTENTEEGTAVDGVKVDSNSVNTAKN